MLFKDTQKHVLTQTVSGDSYWQVWQSNTQPMFHTHFKMQMTRNEEQKHLKTEKQQKKSGRKQLCGQALAPEVAEKLGH
jgi:hypothetical protein